MPEATTETTVELNGVRLYTRRVGHGPPVVVLHGGPGAHHDYLLPQYDHLAEGGRTPLYYDHRARRAAPGPPVPSPGAPGPTASPPARPAAGRPAPPGVSPRAPATAVPAVSSTAHCSLRL